MSMKKYCQKYGKDENKVFEMVLGEGGGILPCPSSFTGYAAEIEDDAVICVNDKLNAKRELAYASFSKAEFGIGGGNLWLQCVVEGRPFVFCSTRKGWKSPAGKLLLEKIAAVTEIKDKKLYEGYTGKLFLIYLFK